MNNYLRKLSIEKLKSLIGNSYLQELSKIAFTEDDNKDLLIECLYAKHFGEPMKDSSVRRALLETLTEEELIFLSDKYAKETFSNKKNNALSLSTINWKKTNSSFISDLISCLDIPKSELPVSQAAKTSVTKIEPVDPLPPLFEYQEELVSKILKALNKEKKFLVQLPTGAGKTRVLMESIIEYIKIKKSLQSGKIILWLAHSEELCEQAIDSCEKIWVHKGDSELSIIRYWGTYKNHTFDMYESFIFASLQKLVSLQRKGDEIFKFIKNHIDVIIVDEAHKTLAPTYKKLITELGRSATIIGTTATPGRNFDKIENYNLAKLYNKKLLTATFPKNAIQYLREQGILSKLNMHFINSNIEVSLSDAEQQNDDFNLETSRRVISLLAKNKERNRLIIQSVIDEVDSGSPCIIFSCSVEHSMVLAGAFALSGYRARHIDCSMNKNNRRRTIESFKNTDYDILINYGVLSTGFDSPRIKTVVITRPTSSIVLYSQMIGRGLRGPAMGGSEFCKIIDIKDNFLNYGEIENVYGFFNDYWE